MSLPTLEEVMPAIKIQIGPLEDLVFSANLKEVTDLVNDPEAERELKEALVSRTNFTAEIVDFIKEIQLNNPGNAELDMYCNRYSDCLRQLRKLCKRFLG